MGIFTGKNESEKALERRLCDEIKRMGGIALKQTSQFHRGVPDRLILLPYHTIAFVELKSTGKKPEPLQEVMLERLHQMHFKTYVVDSTESLNDFLRRMQARLDKFEK